MNRFKVGDILIRRKGSTRYLTVGDIVEVTETSIGGTLRVRLVNDSRVLPPAWFADECFERHTICNEPM